MFIETNVFGAIALAQEVAPHMIKNKSGKIVNIGSVAGVLSTPFSGVYGASKAALVRKYGSISFSSMLGQIPFVWNLLLSIFKL